MKEPNEALKEFTDEQLVDELLARGADNLVQAEFCIEPTRIGDFDTHELQNELADRNALDPDAQELLGDRVVEEWLRSSNPPQVVRDAFWKHIGRIL